MSVIAVLMHYMYIFLTTFTNRMDKRFLGPCWLHWWRTRRKSEKGNFSGQTQFRVGSMKRHKCSTASPSGRKAFVLSHQRPLCAFIWCWSCSSLPLHCVTTLSKPFNWEVDVDLQRTRSKTRRDLELVMLGFAIHWMPLVAHHHLYTCNCGFTLCWKP